MTKVAGGCSVAETTGSQLIVRQHPRGVPSLFWHPSRVRTVFHCPPVVCAALRPPATICQPFRLISVGLQKGEAAHARLSIEAVAVDPVLLNFITDDSFRGVEQLRCPLTAAARCFQRVHNDVSLKGLDG